MQIYISLEYKKFASNYTYVKHTKYKGLGIFIKGNIKITDNNWDSCGIKCYKSININNNFNLVGVWAYDKYIEDYFVFYKKHYNKFNDKTIILGDFNSNAVWNYKSKNSNHSIILSELKNIGLNSAYHYLTKEEQGKENKPTFYWHRHIAKPYHIDYCFINTDLIDKFEILGEKWLEYSDHLPLIIEIKER